MRDCRDDIAHLLDLPARWQDADPTAIAESLLETLLNMLALDVVALRFNDTAHSFVRIGGGFAAVHEADAVLGAINPWLTGEAEGGAVSIGGDTLSVIPVRLGGIASLGVLVAGARRAGFPQDAERMTLQIAATQASLACREVRERSDRPPPADMRAEKPTGEALAESEWRLNLIINTIPAMAWSTAADGMMEFVNQHFVDFVGLPAEEIMGLGFYRIFHPDDTPVLLAAWQEIMTSRRGRPVDGRIQRGDGEYRWCTLRQNPLLDADGNVIKWYGVVLDIEDRKRAEDALKQAKAALLASEHNLNLIVNSLPILAWSARPDGSADFINQSWLDYAGLPADRILGWGFLDLYHPDDIPGMLDTWRRDLEGAEQTALKGRIRGADGAYRWFYFAGRKLTDAHGVVRWFGVNVDIEDLQRAEDALRASEAALLDSERRLQHIINAIPGLVWATDAEGAVTFISQHFLNYTGLSLDEALGHRWTVALHPDDRESHLQIWSDVLASGQPGEVEGRLRQADGGYRWFLFRASPFHDDTGTLTQWFGVNIDIEDRKRAEEELRRSQTELAHVTRMVTMGELAVSIAHEVNQPLMAIVTNAGTCLRWLDDAQQDVALARQAAERIVRDGHRAGDIIASIRALARKSAPRMEPMLLEQVIQEVLDLLRGELQRRGVVAVTEFAWRPTRIVGDSTQLQQVILNLIMNSAEAMADVESRRRRLTIRTLVSEGQAQVSVLDTGVGLQADHVDRMFEAFFSTKPGGIGMGLSICRSIVEAHGGRIWAAGNGGAGSVVSFTLPLAMGVEADARPH